MNDRTEFFVERVLYGHYLNVYVRQGIGVAQPIVFKDQESDLEISPPALQIGMTAAQQLMDELWRAGLRPSEGSGSAGALAATERHLKDMQRIVFKDYS